MQRKQKKKRRRAYTAAELAEVWDRWGRGESSDGIARALNRGTNVYTLLARCGGIRPRARCRSARALTVAEREEISRGIASGRSLRSIASELNRSPSTLSREVRRNGGRTRYRASEADKQAWKRARRPKRCRLVCRPQLAFPRSGKPEETPPLQSASSKTGTKTFATASRTKPVSYSGSTT